MMFICPEALEPLGNVSLGTVVIYTIIVLFLFIKP
jgi:hypothetical protein